MDKFINGLTPYEIIIIFTYNCILIILVTYINFITTESHYHYTLIILLTLINI